MGANRTHTYLYAAPLGLFSKEMAHTLCHASVRAGLGSFAKWLHVIQSSQCRWDNVMSPS